jgi:DNA-binding LytR/AlgR family response regulator
MKILIADDERPARAELQYMLEKLESHATFLQAKNGVQALALLAEHTVDVLFLDINMPALSGLSVATTIMEKPSASPPPLIIFATAYDAHAVRAFELAALDYVVKPFSEARLAQTMVRIRGTLAIREEREKNQEAVKAYLGREMPASLTKLWGERENKTAVLVDYAGILWVEAQGKKVFVTTTAGEKLQVRDTLKELLVRLEPHSFLRIHKGYVVNLNHIAEVVPWFSGTFLVRMNNSTELPMSRQYGKALKQLTGG